MKRFVCVAAAILITAIHGFSAKLPSGPVPGRFIVKFSKRIDPGRMVTSIGPDASVEKMSSLIVRNNLRGGDEWERLFIIQSSTDTLTLDDIVASFGADAIEYVEPDYYLEMFSLPSDPLFPHQWYLNNEGQSYYGIQRIDGPNNDELVYRSGTAGNDIGLAGYYENPPSEATRVVVAIVDTGLDMVHPEMEGCVWHNPGEIPGNGIDDDHNGLVDDTVGYDVSGDVADFFNPQGDMDPTDINGHGTHIAGIIGARHDGQGVAGIASSVEIMPVKIQPNGTSSVGAAGILYAVNSGARVINISWGTPFESSVLKDALDFARYNDVLVCIAPGNTGDNTRFYPAAFDSTFVVGAGNSDGYVTSFSTYGAHLDIVAPGLDILSLRATGTDMYGDSQAGEPIVRIIEDIYYLADGTSMATPMVVGAAAVLLSARPDLSREELEQALLLGAIDLIDPFHNGDTLVGPDTLSGYGYLNIDASLALLQTGGAYIVEPIHRSRHTGDIPVRIAPVAGYTGSWELAWSDGLGSQDWQVVASGASMPPDSLAYIFPAGLADGFVNFRLSDAFGRSSVVTVSSVSGNLLQITSPVEGEDLEFNIPVVGSAYGPDYDSVVVCFRHGNGAVEWLMSSTGEYFDSLIVDWSLSGSDTGSYTIYAYGYFDDTVVHDSVSISVISAFASGWPQPLGGRGGMTAICCDLNHDGIKELAVGTTHGLLLFRADNGQIVDGFPVMPNSDLRCVPAVYDVDGDGWDELIATDKNGIHVFNYDGTTAIDDALLACYTGQISYEYAYPNPTIACLRSDSEPGATPDSAIMIINKLGQILAYRFDGYSYFFGLGGLFTQFSDRITFTFGLGGGTSPFVTALDLTGDGQSEVVASYTSPYPFTGVGLFDGANGQPAFGMAEPTVLNLPYILGTVLTDLNNDGAPDVIAAGWDYQGNIGIWARPRGLFDLYGWPVLTPDVSGWIGSYPIAADLDLDGNPEILITFFEYDISALYIFRADGTPYIEREGRPYGEAFYASVTLGTPAVANLLGDAYPEIIIRSGYILPGTGEEQLYILNHLAEPVPGWPKSTPARSYQVVSSRQAPLIDDIDSDGLVELVLISDGLELLVWDFPASVEDGANTFRFLADNLNSGIVQNSQRSVTGIGDDSDGLLPKSITLRQNFPNPFNPETEIVFTLPSRKQTRLEVFNILGQSVTTLVDREMAAGTHRISFDGSNLATGVYLYRLRVDGTDITRKMLLVK